VGINPSFSHETSKVIAQVKDHVKAVVGCISSETSAGQRDSVLDIVHHHFGIVQKVNPVKGSNEQQTCLKGTMQPWRARAKSICSGDQSCPIKTSDRPISCLPALTQTYCQPVCGRLGRVCEAWFRYECAQALPDGCRCRSGYPLVANWRKFRTGDPK